MQLNKLALATSIIFLGLGNAYAGGGAPAAPDPVPVEPDPVDAGSGSTVSHNLDFDSNANGRKIVKGSKIFNGQTDRIFKDGYGREVSFRGFNVSGEVKLVESGFKPFKNTADAAASFNELGKKNGSNQVRFTVAWEGIHTAPNTIDYAYLGQIVAQMKEAIRNKMYIVVDYHSDLFSRHTFTADSKDTGNGAPEWVVKGGNHGTDNCGLPCQLTWSAHKMNDDAVRSAMRAFWLNSDIATTAGTRKVQDEFIWQIGKVAEYLKANLSAAEFDYVLGFEPLNEPFEAGLSELGLNTYAEFDNQMLWPFYERVRTEITSKGWADKWVYAEPMVFWSSIVGVLAPATGGHHLNYKPGDGFVFAPHFYDQARMGVSTSVARNGTYFANLDQIRDEARFLDLPIFLGEFGMWLNGYGKDDTERVVNGTYQAMEISDLSSGKDRYADFYTNLVSGTQWQWDYYYDKHHEYQNGNPNKLITDKDAWNGENFSVIKDNATGYNVDANMVERAYPRRIQGDLMNFHYNAMVKDEANALLNWGALRVSLANTFENKEYFRGKKFALMTWRGRNADAPTELFIPRHFDTSKLLVVTEKVIKNQTLRVSSSTANEANEVLLTADPAKVSGAGTRLVVWDDADDGEDANTMHYVLVVDNAELSAADITDLQAALTETLVQNKKSAIYMPGDMTHGGYPADHGADGEFSLVNKSTGKCLDVAGGWSTNGTNVQSYECNNTESQKWTFNTAEGQLKTKLNYSKCLDMAGNYSNNANVKIWSCVNSNNQRFNFEGNVLVTRSNASYAVAATSSSNSSNVVMKSKSGSDIQQWIRRY